MKSGKSWSKSKEIRNIKQQIKTFIQTTTRTPTKKDNGTKKLIGVILSWSLPSSDSDTDQHDLRHRLKHKLAPEDEHVPVDSNLELSSPRQKQRNLTGLIFWNSLNALRTKKLKSPTYRHKLNMPRTKELDGSDVHHKLNARNPAYRRKSFDLHDKISYQAAELPTSVLSLADQIPPNRQIEKICLTSRTCGTVLTTQRNNCLVWTWLLELPLHMETQSGP